MVILNSTMKNGMLEKAYKRQKKFEGWCNCMLRAYYNLKDDYFFIFIGVLNFVIWICKNCKFKYNKKIFLVFALQQIQPRIGL